MLCREEIIEENLAGIEAEIDLLNAKQSSKGSDSLSLESATSTQNSNPIQEGYKTEREEQEFLDLKGRLEEVLGVPCIDLSLTIKLKTTKSSNKWLNCTNQNLTSLILLMMIQQSLMGLLMNYSTPL
jgi:hypothetical protein